jgi:hypothetical protein
MKDNADRRGVVLQFPITAEEAAEVTHASKAYWGELERIARLDFKTGRLHHIARHVRDEYFRLVIFADAPWRRG